jgi:hypothetical protein
MRGSTDPRQQAKSDPLLTPILETPEELRAAYRRRRDEFDYQKIHPADEAKYVADGWEPHRLLQSALWIRLNHPGGRPTYQRMINKNRIAQIGAFIQNGGFFPTNILVNFTEACRFDMLPNKHNVDKNNKFGWLYLPNKYKGASKNSSRQVPANLTR